VKVLIAEDDPVSRTVVEAAVAAYGHQVLLAGDGEEAWRLFCDTPDVDVVVSDWMMPRLDGLDLCRRVRGDDQDDYTYYIFLTALDDKVHVLRGIEAGADDYLTKPLDTVDLQIRLMSADRVRTLHRKLTDQNHQLTQLNGELTQLNEHLHEQSRTDPLTGLGNRLKLHEDLQALSDRAERYGHSNCLLLCDVDRFKAYNDRYGHQAGDAVLRRVSEAIGASCRKGDAAYRYGGEEFLVILPEQTADGGAVFADRLRRRVADLEIGHELNGSEGRVTISVGVAAPEEGGATSLEELLAKADAALYDAKATGRNRVVATASPAPG
jgi:two-component system cell cycle response regulator